MQNKKVLLIILAIVFICCCSILALGYAAREGYINTDFSGSITKNGDNEDDTDKDEEKIKETGSRTDEDYKNAFLGDAPDSGDKFKTYAHATDCTTYNEALKQKAFSINYPEYFEFDVCSPNYKSNYIGFYNYDELNYMIDNVNIGYLNATSGGKLDEDAINELFDEIKEDFEDSFPDGTTIDLQDDSNAVVNGVELVRRDYEVVLGDTFENFAKGRFQMRLVAYPSPKDSYGLLFLSFAELDNDTDFSEAIEEIEELYLDEMQSSIRFNK